MPEGTEITRLCVVRNYDQALSQGTAHVTGVMTSALPHPKNNSIEYRFELPDGRRYLGAIPYTKAAGLKLGDLVPVTYAVHDPVASYSPGRMLTASFPRFQIYVLCAMFLVLSLLGKFADGGSKRGPFLAFIFMLPIGAVLIGLAYGARYLNDALDQYTLQVGESVLTGHTVALDNTPEHPDVLILDDRLWVNGRDVGALKAHDHVWLNSGWVVKNGKSLVKYK